MNSLSNRAREQVEHRKLGQNILQRFEKDNHFTENNGKNILEYIRGYEDACLYFIINDDWMLQFLQNLLDEEAKRFFREKRQNVCESYHITKAVLIAK